ncbi:MAG: carboxymuconolactone decarboxylase family protein [Candidatus Baltobacteraceae bacterium]
MARGALDDNAAMARALDEHAAAVMGIGGVSELTKALCAAMIAGLNFCTPSLVRHRKRARDLGAQAAKLNDLWDNARSVRYTDAEKAALAASVALTREPRALPGRLWDDLRAHYTPAQIVELLCAIGVENYRNRVENALQR